MHRKETGGVEKLFPLPGRQIPSKWLSNLFVDNQVTQVTTEEEEWAIVTEAEAEATCQREEAELVWQ